MSRHTESLTRQERIVQRLLANGSAAVSDLAAAFGVSSWTIRRDLTALARRGLLERRYGQASLAAAGAYESFVPAQPAPEEDRASLAGKRAIGRAAARLVQPGQHLALSAGSTTLEVARALRDRALACRVVTNALNIAMELSAATQVRVTCSGGEVDGDYYTLNGPTAERALGSYYFDLAIIGVSGLAVHEGLTVNSQLNAVALGTMLDHATRVVVVADRRKFGKVRFAHLTPLDRLDALVTDAEPPAELAERLAAHGVSVIVAQPT